MVAAKKRAILAGGQRTSSAGKRISKKEGGLVRWGCPWLLHIYQFKLVKLSPDHFFKLLRG